MPKAPASIFGLLPAALMLAGMLAAGNSYADIQHDLDASLHSALNDLEMYLL